MLGLHIAKLLRPRRQADGPFPSGAQGSVQRKAFQCTNGLALSRKARRRHTVQQGRMRQSRMFHLRTAKVSRKHLRKVTLCKLPGQNHNVSNLAEPAANGHALQAAGKCHIHNVLAAVVPKGQVASRWAK